MLWLMRFLDRLWSRKWVKSTPSQLTERLLQSRPHLQAVRTLRSDSLRQQENLDSNSLVNRRRSDSLRQKETSLILNPLVNRRRSGSLRQKERYPRKNLQFSSHRLLSRLSSSTRPLRSIWKSFHPFPPVESLQPPWNRQILQGKLQTPRQLHPHLSVSSRRLRFSQVTRRVSQHLLRLLINLSSLWRMSQLLRRQSQVQPRTRSIWTLWIAW